MKFLIVTINKNNSEGLARTIDSLRSQSFSSFRFVVIDGASVDHSLDIIHRNLDLIDYWVSEPDSGIYSAMNKGTASFVRDCQYVVYMNSGDSFYSSETLQLVSDLIDSNASEEPYIIYGHTILRSNSSLHALAFRQCRSFSYINVNMPMHHQSVYFPLSILGETPYNESYRMAGDYELVARLHSLGHRFLIFDYPLSVFNQYGLSYSACMQRVGDLELRRIKRNIFQKSPVLCLIDSLALRSLNSIREYPSLFAALYQTCLTLLSSLRGFILGLRKIISFNAYLNVQSPGNLVLPSVEHHDVLSFLVKKGVAQVIDIGANRGQFFLETAAAIVDLRYIGFEPLPDVYSTLLRTVSSRSLPFNPILINALLSDRRSTLSFNVTRKKDCSSYLEPLQSSAPSRLQSAQSKVSSLLIDSTLLDDYTDYISMEHDTLVKLDVQGSELDVLKGGETLLRLESVKWIYCEMSEVVHYKGQCLLGDLVPWLRARGFFLYSLHNTNFRSDGLLAYCDALFKRI